MSINLHIPFHKFILRSNIYGKLFKTPSKKRCPMIKLLSLLLCLLLLAGCAAPAEQVQPPAATEAAAATPVPTPDVTPSPTFTPRPTTFAAMHTPSPTYSGSGYRTPPPVPVQYFEPEEGEKILFRKRFPSIIPRATPFPPRKIRLP